MQTLRAAGMAALLVALMLPSLSAQETTPWTPEDIVFQSRGGGWRLSDDGSRALWTKSRMDRAKNRTASTLMLTEMASGEHRAITVGKGGFSSAAFSPDGRFVSFLSSRDFPEGTKGPDKKRRGMQVWLLDLRGGEPRPLTSVEGGVSSYRWHDDETIFLSAREARTLGERRREKAKDDVIVVEGLDEYRERGRQLFRFDVEKRKLKRLSAETGTLQSFAVSPDGRWAVCSWGQSPSYTAEGEGPPRVCVHDLQDGSVREIFADRLTKPGGAVWRLDSAGFFVRMAYSTFDGESWGAIQHIKEVAVPDLAVRHVNLRAEFGAKGGLVATADGFVTGLCGGVRPTLARYTRRHDGGYDRHDLKVPEGNAFGLAKARDADTVLVTVGALTMPDRTLAGKLLGGAFADLEQIHVNNGGWKNKRFARTEILHWTGAEGARIEGILHHPFEREPGQKAPLILVTHGGPHGADLDRFSERWANSPNLWAQKGAFVLRVNYQGSSDYGLAFGEAIRHRYYELEVEDMLAGVRTLEARGVIDTKRLGLVGWSNGAILSAACLTHARSYAKEHDYVFRFCSFGAGDVNWTSDYGNCSFGASFDDFYLGGPPWEVLEAYIEKSPLFRVTEVSTPTIIFHGANDRAVPTEQGWQWFRALRRAKKTDVRFLLFPGQGHGLAKGSYQLRKLKEEIAWADRYLFEEKAEEVLVDEGTPLDLARRARSHARTEAGLGVMHEGKLIPETVPTQKGYEIGRFELTHAQYAAFDGAHTVPDGRANAPVHDLSAERATAYVGWLSELTGRTYRLPTLEEHRALAGKAGGSAANTLDRWAGRMPPPSERAALSAAVLALGPERILRVAGASRPGTLEVAGGKVDVFDLRGNVAEWATDGEGHVATGASATTLHDPRDPTAKPNEALRGLRVLLETR